MKNKEISPIYNDTLDKLEDLIEENEKLFQTNISKIKMVSDINEYMENYSTSAVKQTIRKWLMRVFNFLLRPIVERQNEVNMLLLNMVQDLKRLQNHLADRAYLKAQIDLVSNLQIEVNHSDKLTKRDIQFLYNVMNHPLFSRERSEKCIIQIVSTLNFGDAVGNDALAIKHALKENGYITAIFAESIHEKVNDLDVIPLNYLPELREDDVVIYHFASADAFSSEIIKINCKKVLRYHNITPPTFFQGFDEKAEMITKQGLLEVQKLAQAIDYGLIVSEFNKEDLISMGYECPLDVVPILIPFSDYEKEPDLSVIQKYKDGKTNILFVGRGAPNKKIEDVIRSFMCYKRQYDNSARLFLVGNYDVKGRYYKYLQKVLKEEKAEDVIFPGHISFAEILAYYQVADVFLCMSEHEGFCVPLVEAMFFGVPIVAYNSSAVPDTLNGSGVLIYKKDVGQIAEMIHKIVLNEEYAAQIVAGEKKRLTDFQYEKIKEKIISFLENRKLT